MKRYALFAGESYYPMGGGNDIVGFFDTKEEVLSGFQELKKSSEWKRTGWAHVVDFVSQSKILKLVSNELATCDEPLPHSTSVSLDGYGGDVDNVPELEEQ